MSTDVTVRCHRCACPFEVVAYPDDLEGGVYTVPAGLSPSCPHCGYRHPSGLDMPPEALTTALNELHPLRRRSSAKPSEVESTMSKDHAVRRPDPEDEESRRRLFYLTLTYGAPVFGLCAVYAYETERTGVDLGMQCGKAVLALVRGESLEAALACIRDDAQGGLHGHRAAPVVGAALAALPPFGPFAERLELYNNVFDMHRAFAPFSDVPFEPLAAAVHELVVNPDATPRYPDRDLEDELRVLHARARRSHSTALNA